MLNRQNDEAMEKVGKEGVITVEEAKSMTTELDVVEGMQFDRGYISPYFVTNAEKMVAELEDACILINEKKLSSLQPLLPVLEAVIQARRVAVIKVGGATEVEVKERKDRVEDALHATRAAVEEGIVPGGGVALLRAAAVLDGLNPENHDQKAGIHIVRKALAWPARRKRVYQSRPMASAITPKPANMGISPARASLTRPRWCATLCRVQPRSRDC